MKLCSKCKNEKNLFEFRRDATRKGGLSYICKSCNIVKDRIRYENDKDNQRARGVDYYWRDSENKKKQRKERYWANPDEARLINRNKYWENPEKERNYVKEWRLKNPTKVLTYNSKRRAEKIQAAPSWLSAIQLAQIQEMYDIAKASTVQTGVIHHVDHCHPLKGKNFCGIHVPWNLKVITASENLRKYNRFPSDEQHLTWSK